MEYSEFINDVLAPIEINKPESDISRSKDILYFGKYKGKSIGEVYKKDAQYLMWRVEKNILKLSPQYIGQIKSEANYQKKYRTSDYAIHCWAEDMMDYGLDIGPNI